MFRDSKEYQEIAKIYDEKVSKSGELNERVKGGGVSTAPKININIPKAGSGGSGNVRGAGVKPGISLNKSTGMGGAQGRTKRPEPEIKKPMPTTAEIRAKDKAAGGTGMSNIPKAEGSAVIDGKKLNPNFGKKSEIKPEVKKPEVKKPEVSTMTKQGKPRTKAQMIAAKRIASGKTIQQVKDENTKSMKARAKERFEKFKADREAKRLERMKEEYTPYDMVLEYLLSTEQVATIEEANYVMMQLDEENIQEIVGQVAKVIMKTPLVKLVPAAIGTGIATKMIASKMGQKSGEKEIQKSTTPVPMGDSDAKKSDPIKDLIPNIKKRNKALEDAIEKS